MSLSQPHIADAGDRSPTTPKLQQRHLPPSVEVSTPQDTSSAATTTRPGQAVQPSLAADQAASLLRKQKMCVQNGITNVALL